jgi:hypothetical protein
MIRSFLPDKTKNRVKKKKEVQTPGRQRRQTRCHFCFLTHYVLRYRNQLLRKSCYIHAVDCSASRQAVNQ